MACSASHNPHQFGFEFDQSHVAHSRKVIPSQLPRFEYEYRFAEYRPPRRTEYEYDEIECEARSTRIDQVQGGDFTQAKTNPRILLTILSSFRVFGVFRFRWTSRRRAFDQILCGLVYKPTGRVPFDCGSLGDAQGSSGSSQARQTLEVRIWKRG